MASARRMAHSRSMIVTDAETRIEAQYTLDTLRILKARFPGVHFVWLMGADNLQSFHRWKGMGGDHQRGSRGGGLAPLGGAEEPIRPRRPPLRRLSLAFRAGQAPPLCRTTRPGPISAAR